MELIKTIIILIMCHLIGDYGIHREFISVTKGDNWYHMFIHCTLYCVPFLIVFGFQSALISLFITHFITDTLKARYNILNYKQDQVSHYIALLVYLYPF